VDPNYLSLRIEASEGPQWAMSIEWPRPSLL